jgi:hypothetical protein
VVAYDTIVPASVAEVSAMLGSITQLQTDVQKLQTDVVEANKPNALIYKGERSTTGTWVITGLTPNVPAYFTAVGVDELAYMYFAFEAGTHDAIRGTGQSVGQPSSGPGPNKGCSLLFMPSESTVEVSISAIRGTIQCSQQGVE